MTTRRRQLLGAISLVAAAGLVLTGCSGDSGGGGGGGGGESVTITLWHNTQDPQAVLNLYSAYEEATGNKIELVPITSDGFEDATLTKWASGDRPDVLEFHATSDYIAQLNPTENLNPLSDMSFVERSGSLYDLGGRGADGEVYASITNFPEVWGLYYNKAMLADNGLEPATTFDDLLEQCEVFNGIGVPMLAESGGSLWPLVAMSLTMASSSAPDGWGASVGARDANVNDPDSPLLDALEKHKQLLDAGCAVSDITTATFENSVDRVYNGEAVYQAIHSNIAPVYLDAAGGDAEALGEAVGFTAFGNTEQTVFVNPGPIGTYFLPKTGDAAREAAAREFIEFATGEYNQTYINESGTFPILDGVDDPADAGPLMLDIKRAYDEVPQVSNFSDGVPGGIGPMINLMSELVVGQKSPQDVVDAIQKNAETAGKAQGLPGW